MNIHLDNVSLDSNTGPNSFGRKLVKYMEKSGHTFDYTKSGDISLAFIQATEKSSAPLVQRLDGIYFNTVQDYKVQNHYIEETYKRADGVIFQSNFNKELTFKYFGPHKNYTIIHNGADVEEIEKTEPAPNDRFSEIWCCASSWRPHKRLDENIRYFLEHAPEGAGLVVAGGRPSRVNHPRVFYAGEISQGELYAIYKASKYFLHLAWLDHCPNVVTDARACGCKIVCSSTGGTKEIAGPDAVIIGEAEWDFGPVNLYNPPPMNFIKKIKNTDGASYDMNLVAKKYEAFMESVSASHS